MRLLITGVNHKTAPVEVREKLAFGEPALAPALRDLMNCAGVSEAVILFTCNRVEIAVAAENGDEPAVDRFLSESRSVPLAEIAPHLYRLAGEDAIHHLFRVAASLDSMVIGEPQILGQIKSAYASAKAHGAVSGYLEAILYLSLQRRQTCAHRDRNRRERGLRQLCVGSAVQPVSQRRKLATALSSSTRASWQSTWSDLPSSLPSGSSSRR